MSEEKEVKKPSQEELLSSLNAAWAMIRRLKDYLEKIFGADIDGDGHIGPWKAAVLALIISAASVFGASPSTNNIWALTDKTGTNIITYVDKDGNFVTTGTLGASSTSLVINASSTNLTVTGTLEATGVATLSSNVDVGVNLTVGGTTVITGHFTASDDSHLDGGIKVDTDAFTVADSTGNTTVKGSTELNTLSVTGAHTAVGTITAKTVNIGSLAAQTNATVGGTLTIAGVTTMQGGFSLTNSSGEVSIPTNYVVGLGSIGSALTNGLTYKPLTLGSNILVQLPNIEKLLTNTLTQSYTLGTNILVQPTTLQGNIPVARIKNALTNELTTSFNLGTNIVIQPLGIKDNTAGGSNVWTIALIGSTVRLDTVHGIITNVVINP